MPTSITTQPLLPQPSTPPAPVIAAPSPALPPAVFTSAYSLPLGQVLQEMTERGAIIGLKGGALLGAAFGVFLYIIGAFVGVVIGAIVGITLGVICGFLLGLISRYCFYPLTRPIWYRFCVAAISILLAGVGSYLAFRTLFGGDDPYNLLVTIPSLLATCYAIWASQQAAAKYILLAGILPRPQLHARNIYDHTLLRQLFDEMQGSYELVSSLCSFGFNKRWRKQVGNLIDLRPGMQVADLMSGSGETWHYVLPRLGSSGGITALDFSRRMVQRARERALALNHPKIVVSEQNVLHSLMPQSSFDAAICCYGVKTLSQEQQELFVKEIARILKPNGLFAIAEISTPQNSFLRWPYLLYLRLVVPLIGRVALANPYNYQMLHHYTVRFDNCRHLTQLLKAHGFEVHTYALLGGCATALVGMKGAQP